MDTDECADDDVLVFTYPDAVFNGVVVMTEFTKSLQYIAFERETVAGLAGIDVSVQVGDVAEVAGMQLGPDVDGCGWWCFHSRGFYIVILMREGGEVWSLLTYDPMWGEKLSDRLHVGHQFQLLLVGQGL